MKKKKYSFLSAAFFSEGVDDAPDETDGGAAGTGEPGDGAVEDAGDEAVERAIAVPPGMSDQGEVEGIHDDGVTDEAAHERWEGRYAGGVKELEIPDAAGEDDGHWEVEWLCGGFSFCIRGIR